MTETCLVSLEPETQGGGIKMFGISIPQLLIILGIVFLVFGSKRIKSLGEDLGGAIKGFRSAAKDLEDIDE